MKTRIFASYELRAMDLPFAAIEDKILYVDGTKEKHTIVFYCGEDKEFYRVNFNIDKNPLNPRYPWDNEEYVKGVKVTLMGMEWV